jgi:uncharacterized membrane protein YkvA (DUF1232 family)
MNKWRQRLGAVNKAALWRYLTALWLLLRDPRTPRTAKLVAALVVAYALSPIDLIPDFIPVLGQLDDLLLLPLGVALAVRLVPPALWQEMLQLADARRGRLPPMVWGLVLVGLVWLALLALSAWGVATWWAAA